MKIKRVLPLLFLGFLVSGCVETVVVGTIAAGVMIASEKSAGQTKDDILIHSKVNGQFKKDGLNEKLSQVDVKVYEGRVILLGKVDSKDNSKDAVNSAWKVEGVKEVIDETMVYVNKEKPKMIKAAGRNTKDAVITSQVKTRLIKNRNVKSVNFDVETIDGIVYLLGVGQDRYEIEQSAKIASQVRGVKKVISHVVLKDDARRAEL